MNFVDYNNFATSFKLIPVIEFTSFFVFFFTYKLSLGPDVISQFEKATNLKKINMGT